MEDINYVVIEINEKTSEVKIVDADFFGYEDACNSCSLFKYYNKNKNYVYEVIEE